jgi:hypothetical protein
VGKGEAANTIGGSPAFYLGEVPVFPRRRRTLNLQPKQNAEANAEIPDSKSGLPRISAMDPLGPKTTAYEAKNARKRWLIKRIPGALAGACAYPVGVHFGVQLRFPDPNRAMILLPLDEQAFLRAYAALCTDMSFAGKSAGSWGRCSENEAGFRPRISDRLWWAGAELLSAVARLTSELMPTPLDYSWRSAAAKMKH